MIIKNILNLLLIFFTYNLFSQTVYINNHNYKYHTKECKKVKSSYYGVDLMDALKNNFYACKECKPPISIEDETLESKEINQIEIVEIDSIKEQRLYEYKKLYDNGLIDIKEYSKLKGSILLVDKPVKKTSKKEYDLKTLKTNYISEFCSGSFFIAGGLGLLSYGFYYKNNKYPNPLKYINNSTRFVFAVSDYGKKYKILLGTGGGILGLGFILEMLGLKDKLVYLNQTNKVAIGFAKENLGLAFYFK